MRVEYQIPLQPSTGERRLPVAQISNLPYRRFPIGRPLNGLGARAFRRSAGWKPAIQQIRNLRYVKAK
jgi:hypothetical protein